MVSDTLKRIHPGRVLRSRPVRDYFWMTLGILITAFALDAFLIPNRIAAGGVSGLATVIYYTLKDAHLPVVPVGVSMLVINVGLLAIGIRLRGWRYGAKTLYGALGLSIAIDLMAPFIHAMATGDKLLAVLWGGALCGIGMGMVFRVGGNTGGTDIVAQLLVRRTGLGVGQLILIADGFVTVCAAIAFGPNLALYGLVAVFIQGFIIDLVMEGVSVEKACYIMSDEYARIGRAVLDEMGRGATLLHGIGMWTDEERPVILTVISRREIDALKEIVRSVDPTAFVIVSDVREVLGEGFKEFEG